MTVVPASAPLRIAVLTVSDGVTAGARDDVSGSTIVAWVEARGASLCARRTVPDATGAIAAALVELADSGECDAILTTGGTGLTRRDVTPEATAAVIERDAPGIAERIRADGIASTPFAALARGRAGVRGATLIVNLPGSAGGVRDGLRVLDDIIDHAVQLLRGEDTDRHEPADG
ncbi:MogA/MoaB family molybdenum cofactor biosynthesis protein [soil metagenome]